MYEALDAHEGSASIGGRLITNFRFADDFEAGVLYNHYKIQNGDLSR